MTTLLFTLMIISGILFIGSVLLMAPKGGLGFGIGGMSTSNEYGSKKSLEWTLKKSAILSIVVFTVCAMLYPYANKKNHQVINTNNVKQQAIKLNPADIKVNTKDAKNVEVKTVPTTWN